MEIIADVFGAKVIRPHRDPDALAQIAFLERRRAAVSELFKEYVCPYEILKWPRPDDYSTVSSHRLASCKNLTDKAKDTVRIINNVLVPALWE